MRKSIDMRRYRAESQVTRKVTCLGDRTILICKTSSCDIGRFEREGDIGSTIVVGLMSASPGELVGRIMNVLGESDVRGVGFWL